MIVRCNNCMWTGEETDLVIRDDKEYCPHCRLAGHIMDLEDYGTNITLHKDSPYFPVTINKEICVEIKRSDAGYIIDVWNVANNKIPDLIDTITVWDSDIN